jgi:hypothetical protein
MRRLVLLTASLLGLPAIVSPLQAGYVLPSNGIEFQVLTTDMIAASAGDVFGTDPSSLFTYNGSFNQAGWNGTFGGTYQGNPVSGTMSASVFGDPNYTVTGGITMTPAKGKPFDAALEMTLVDQGNGKFDLKNTQIGNINPWKWSGTVTDTVNGMDHTLAGMLTLKRPGAADSTWDVSITIKGTGLQQSISSTFKNKKNPKETYTDTGTVQFSELLGANFNGMMNEQVATAPEPSSLVLLGVGCLSLAGYRWRRRKQIV